MPKPPASCVGAEPARQLDQRQRVAACLGDDPVADPLVQHEPDRRVQEGLCVAVSQALDLELRDVLELLARHARGEHESHRLGQQAPRHEGERQRRGLVQPLRVVDDAQEGPSLGGVRQEAEHRQTHQEPVGCGPGAHAEDDAERVALGSREPVEPVEQRPAQLVEARVGQLHLRLHPHRPGDREVRRGGDQVIEQRGLPDPCLTAQDERTALAPANPCDQLVQEGTLARPAGQAGVPPRSQGPAFHRPAPSLERAARAPQDRARTGGAGGMRTCPPEGRLAQGAERRAQLGAEELRLLPGGEVPAPVDRVVVGEAG